MIKPLPLFRHAQVPVVNTATTTRNNHLHINQSVGNCRAGSLPNVNHIGSGSENNIDLKSALNNLEDIQHGREPRERRNVSPVGSFPGRNSHHPPGGHHSRSVHSSERKRQDASPYSTPYLSPPDTWRRTNSDSALHQSAMLAEQHDTNPYQQMGSPASPRRALHQSMVNTGSVGPQMGHLPTSISWDPGKQRQDYSQYSTSPEQTVLLTPSVSSVEGSNDGSRPKSCEVPGITIYPTQEDPNGHSQHHIPLSSNTGSLPDLTSLHFPAPLATPIDLEDQSAGGSHANSVPTTSNTSPLQYGGAPPPSPYSTTSNCGSPYSPQSPNSVHSNTFSPPPQGIANHHHMTGGGIMFEVPGDAGIKSTQLNMNTTIGTHPGCARLHRLPLLSLPSRVFNQRLCPVSHKLLQATAEFQRPCLYNRPLLTNFTNM